MRRAKLSFCSFSERGAGLRTFMFEGL
jgi:hypothetical protein